MLSRGLRSTEQRRLIVDHFFRASGHETIDTLLEAVRATDAHIGYATVYRTMKMLVESGVANEQRFGDGFTRYELNDTATHHDHLICSGCGRIDEFEEPLIEELQERVARRYGYTLMDHKLELHGLCADCQNKR